MCHWSRRLLVIGGPTASGKTALALKLARRWGGEIISADSRTVYQGMDIGTAKPEGEFILGGRLVEGIPYLGLDLVRPDERYSVAAFQAFALAHIERLWAANKLPILVGGTGLYVRAVVDGYSVPANSADPKTRTLLEAKPLGELVDSLLQRDLAAASQVDLKNKVRVIRALETVLTSGQPLKQTRTKSPLAADTLQIGIHVPRFALYDRINARVHEMLSLGFLDEVKSLVSAYGGDAPALSAIGYQQLLPVVASQLPLQEAVAQIQQATRQYAKRQLTWWRAEKRLIWTESNHANDFVSRWLNTG